MDQHRINTGAIREQYGSNTGASRVQGPVVA